MAINPFLHALGKVTIEVPKERGAIYYCPDTAPKEKEQHVQEGVDIEAIDKVINQNATMLSTKGYISRAQMAELFGISYYQMTKIFVRMIDRGLLIGPELINHDKYYRYIGENYG